MTIRLRVAELRAARGWTQEQLVERAGVGRATVSRIESETDPPTRIDLPTLEKLAAAFGVDPGYLLVHVDDTKRKRGRS